jgi:Family of unknown function (DUF5985)
MNHIQALKPLLAGGIMVAAWAIFVFFVRFSRKTRDSFFLWFAVAFLLVGVERVAIFVVGSRASFLVYLIRLTAFLLIITAIWDKNRRGKGNERRD